MRDKKIWTAAAVGLLAVCVVLGVNKGYGKNEDRIPAGSEQTESIADTEKVFRESPAETEEKSPAETGRNETEEETREAVQTSEERPEAEGGTETAAQDPGMNSNAGTEAEEGALPETAAAPEAGAESQAGAEAADGSQEEVPQAGFFENAQKTEELYRLLAVQNTNNCDLSDPYCSMTADYLARLNTLAESWLQGAMTDAETVKVMENTEFYWPEDPYQTASHLTQAFAGCYEYSGGDMNVIAGRINLTNMMARHYLFLRVFYDAQADRCRVYMINGLVW